jgi:ligand-binding SRPBCC domain-containing protein
MPLIQLEIWIDAPIERVFDLARSIDAHMLSTDGTEERAIAGRTSGLIELGESVTWEARHFGIKQQLTVKIIAFDRPHLFGDEMVRGAFSCMRHTHRFTECKGGTLMSDEFFFTAPLGILGRIAEVLFLTRYIRNFLNKRSLCLKQLAESDDWQKFVSNYN